MVLRPGGGRRRASGLGEKRRVPRGLCRPPCAAVHASQSPFGTTRVCRGRGHSGVAKIRWGRWKLTLSWLPLCACPGTRPAPGVAEVPRVPTYALLVTVCSHPLTTFDHDKHTDYASVRCRMASAAREPGTGHVNGSGACRARMQFVSSQVEQTSHLLLKYYETKYC
jgi:hypothetical protein